MKTMKQYNNFRYFLLIISITTWLLLGYIGRDQYPDDPFTYFKINWRGYLTAVILFLFSRLKLDKQ